MDRETRLNKIRKAMQENGWQGFLVSKPENVFYLSGFTGEGVLLIGETEMVILTDPRFTEQAEMEASGWLVVVGERKDAAKYLADAKKVAFESHHLTYREYQVWLEVLGDRLEPALYLVEKFRMIKEEAELELLKKALAIGDAVFSQVLNEIHVGAEEEELACFIQERLRREGCEKEAFPTIVASGHRSALPHGRPSSKTLELGELVIMDFGGFYKGYAGDMTRTVAVGKSCARIRSIYTAVLDAQLTALDAIRSGVSCREVDEAARCVLRRHGLERFFTHSTGHGLGLEVHELPAVGAKSQDVLEEGMVITVEPAVYIRGWGGVRIEDVVVVKRDGCELLTKAEKDLIVV